ncbi:MAG: hypothetical protein SGI98_10470 [Verrucomicrobiota bacterium]|nr:hypothetical protein [Verrucomicrobiota bacterium]
MSNLDHRGYVAIFAHPLTEAVISDIVGLWLGRFDQVEQVLPDVAEGATKIITSVEEIASDTSYSFRISNGEDFAWAYLTKDRHAIETTSFPGTDEIPAMCLTILVELPNIKEIVDEHDNKRLNELESAGLF